MLNRPLTFPSEMGSTISGYHSEMLRGALSQPVGNSQAISLLDPQPHMSCLSHWRQERIRREGRARGAWQPLWAAWG